MPVQFKWRNMAEQFEILRRLPDDLKAEAEGLVEARADHAAFAIRQSYPRGATGNLREGVVVEIKDGGRFGVRARVLSRAPHAWIYDEGTAARHTELGWARGAMPATHVFVKTMIRERRALFTEDFAELLSRHGMVPHGRP